MEDNQAFEADAAINAQTRNRGDSKHKGADAMVAAVGSFDPHASEDSPLLGDSARANNGVDKNGGDAPWAGAADLEGLGWWHRPSVSGLKL